MGGDRANPRREPPFREERGDVAPHSVEFVSDWEDQLIELFAELVAEAALRDPDPEDEA